MARLHFEIVINNREAAESLVEALELARELQANHPWLGELVAMLEVAVEGIDLSAK